MNPPARRFLVIGIGNPDRGDDAAGRVVARLLRGTLPDDVDVLDQEGEATGLLACLDGARSAILVDASASAASPGTVRRFDVSTVPLASAGFAASTHGFGLADAVELARVLGQLPRRCIVYAIEGASFAIGDAMTPAVAAAARLVADRVREEISQSTRGDAGDA